MQHSDFMYTEKNIKPILKSLQIKISQSAMNDYLWGNLLDAPRKYLSHYFDRII